MVSVHYLQSGHCQQFVYLRFSRRSAVHILFWLANQAKNFTFDVATPFKLSCTKMKELSRGIPNHTPILRSIAHSGLASKWCHHPPQRQEWCYPREKLTNIPVEKQSGFDVEVHHPRKKLYYFCSKNDLSKSVWMFVCIRTLPRKDNNSGLSRISYQPFPLKLDITFPILQAQGIRSLRLTVKTFMPTEQISVYSSANEPDFNSPVISSHICQSQKGPRTPSKQLSSSRIWLRGCEKSYPWKPASGKQELMGRRKWQLLEPGVHARSGFGTWILFDTNRNLTFNSRCHLSQ
jgi:hypothetical protein